MQRLPYLADPLPLLRALRPLGAPVLLRDSGPQPRDLLTAGPCLRLEAHGHALRHRQDGSWQEALGDPFEALDALFHRAAEAPRGAAAEAQTPRVFGLAGYDTGRDRPATPQGFPDLVAGLYDWLIRTDHDTRRSWLVTTPGRPVPAELRSALAEMRPVQACTPPTLRPEQPRAAYGRAFERVQAYLRAGDCYQVNLAVPFSGPFDGDPIELFAALSARQPAPFSGYLETADSAVLSCSPERLLRVTGRTITASPIKGTRARGADPAADAAARAALSASEKDRAENLMIVDLLRNDLGRSCEPGSIDVPQLFAVESYAAVHHLVSTIRGRLAAGTSAVEAFAAAFPGGSITGAPKRRAMEIIDELEPRERGPYCGSLFHGRGRDTLDASITIRTLLAHDGRLSCWGGGAIVVDSYVDAEWDEIHAKVGSLISG